MNKKVVIILAVLVVCCIITIITAIFILPSLLIGTSLTGVQQVQNSVSDVQKIQLVESLNLEVNYYKGYNGIFPEIVRKDNLGFYFNNETLPVINATELDLKQPFNDGEYCYSKISEIDYALGVKLNSGEWKNFGTVDCKDSNILN